MERHSAGKDFMVVIMATMNIMIMMMIMILITWFLGQMGWDWRIMIRIITMITVIIMILILKIIIITNLWFLRQTGGAL